VQGGGPAMKLGIETKVYAFFCAAFAGVVILGFVTYQSTRELIVNDSWVSHTHQLRQSLADLLSAVPGAETSRQEYLLTGDSKYRVQFLAGLDQIRPDVRKITQLTADDPVQRNKFHKLTALTEQILSIWAATAHAARAGKSDGEPIPPVAREFELRVCVADLSALVDEMNKAEEHLLQTQSGTARRSGKRAVAIAVLGGGFSTLVVLFAIAILHRDLAERRRAEEALRRREAELKEAQRLAAVGSWEWVVKTDTVTWSEELYHIAGRDPRGPVPGYKEHGQLYAPESWRRLQSAVERALKTGMSYELDLQMIRPDGSTRWVAARGEAERDVTGRITRLRGTSQDITERKRAEHKIQEQANLLELASDAILVRDLNEKILFWNKSAERLYGWTAEEAIGADFVKMTYEDPAPFEASKRTLLEKGEWSGEARKPTKTGSELIVASRWTLLLDDSGNPRSILVIDTDITEKKQMESLFLRNQRLESIGQLAGGIAHDLNNILAPILMGAQMLRQNGKDPDNSLLLATIEGNAQRGAEIVKQVVAFAKGVEGKKVILQPRYVIAEISWIIRETFPKSITLKINEQENLWTVLGDVTQLHQVLLNLAVNSRDAMPHGGTLTLSADNVLLDEAGAALRPGLKPGPHVIFRVSDSGTGIAPNIAHKIFDPFFTTKDPDKGTGLGLSTVLGIVKSHRGHIEFDSKLAQGTEFRIYLPAEPERQDSLSTKQRTPEALPRGRGELILIVDDEESVRSVMKRILESHGYRTLAATRGTEAVACYLERGTEISVVLTDLHMPDMGGAEAIAVLRELNPRIRIIVATGAGSPPGGNSVHELGVQAYIKKPFDLAHLLGTLQRVLHQEKVR
jgi:PAS domain S-box-containing protein